MSMPWTAACAVLLIFALNVEAVAQRENKGKAMDRKSAKGKGGRSRQAALTVDQQSALMALDRLLGEAKSFKSSELRVRTHARVADMLWGYDEPRARRLFAEAFTEADSLDAARPASGASPPAPALPHNNLRGEVLARASRHDAELAEKLAASAAGAAAAGRAAPENRASHLKALSGAYLEAALGVVESDPERAAQLIELSLHGGIDRMLPRALAALRVRRPAAAQEIFGRALAVAGSDTARLDEQTRLLASYVFPGFGMPAGVPGHSPPAADPAESALIRSFLNFTLDVAVRWHNKVLETGNQPAAVRDVYDYDTARALQPYFVQHLPDRADQFRGLVGVMSQSVPRWQTNELADKMAQPVGFDEAVKEAEEARDSLQKDLLYFRAAAAAAGRGEFERALSLVEKVGGEDFRVGFDAALRLGAVNSSVSGGEIEQAYRYAVGALDVRQRAALLGRIANALIDKKDTSQALRILDEAEQLIGRAAEGRDKAQAVLTLANARARIDPVRGFENMEAAVKAFNRAAAGAGEAKPAKPSDAIFSAMISRMLGAEAPDFERGFSALARSDFNRALELARSLEDDHQAAPAQLAVCHSVLLKTRPA